ncbi:MAG: leucine-rich repeat domain-containing protein [Thermonemataceae bacterium]
MKPEFLSKEEAQKKFNLVAYKNLVAYERFIDVYVYFEGDLELQEGLYEETLQDLFFEGDALEGKNILFIIKGNLKVNGDISIPEEFPCLLVLGDVHCTTLVSEANSTHITGDVYIQYAFDGNGNEGDTTIEGTTHVPYLLNYDHNADLTPTEDTITINYYSDYNDAFYYDYFVDELPQFLVKEAFYTTNEEAEKEVFDEERFKHQLRKELLNEPVEYEQEKEAEFDRMAFLNIVEKGFSPFKKGAKSYYILMEETIVKLAQESREGASIKHLDLTRRRLSKLPKALFEIEMLEELILEENSFTAIPEALGNLKNLKVLNLKHTLITSLPSTIEQLESLTILDLRYCRNLKALPSAIFQLKKLEQLKLKGSNIPEDDLKKLKELNPTIEIFI